MISISKIYIKDIPILMVADAKRMNEELKTVVYYHGFNGEKESSLTIAYKIAEKGFRVILPDSIYHGDRRQDISQHEMDLAFWEIIFRSITELKEIKAYLEANKLVIPGCIGIGGTSMGGMMTYGALMKYDWLKAATVLMGTPQLSKHAKKMMNRFNKANEKQITEVEKKETIERLEKIDISKYVNNLNNRPLFIWHGEKDEIIPVTDSESIIDEFEAEYVNKDRLKLIVEQGRTHNISRLSIEETARWFKKYL